MGGGGSHQKGKEKRYLAFHEMDTWSLYGRPVPSRNRAVSAGVRLVHQVCGSNEVCILPAPGHPCAQAIGRCPLPGSNRCLGPTRTCYAVGIWATDIRGRLAIPRGILRHVREWRAGGPERREGGESPRCQEQRLPACQPARPSARQPAFVSATAERHPFRRDSALGGTAHSCTGIYLLTSTRK